VQKVQKMEDRKTRYAVRRRWFF